MAHDEKSRFLTFHTKIACHTVRDVVGFPFLERSILNTENDEIPCGPNDQRKRCHFSVRCYMTQINPHFQFASLLIGHFFSKKFFNTGQRVIPNRNSGEAMKISKISRGQYSRLGRVSQKEYLLDRIVQFLVHYERLTSLSWFSFLIQK